MALSQSAMKVLIRAALADIGPTVAAAENKHTATLDALADAIASGVVTHLTGAVFTGTVTIPGVGVVPFTGVLP